MRLPPPRSSFGVTLDGLFGDESVIVVRYLRDFAFAVLLVVALWSLVAFLAILGFISRFRPKKTGERSDPQLVQPGATVIILNWNGRDLLAECLPSIIADAKRSPSVRDVTVVDNASTDDSVAFLRKCFPDVNVLEQPANLGFAGGCNAGVLAAQTTHVVVLNNDMKVEPGFFSSLLGGFTRPNIFAVTAQIFFWDRTKLREETGKTRGHVVAGHLAVGHDVPVDLDLPYQPIFYAGGGSSAYDRAKFLQLGGFDSLYEPFYVEDCDLSYRAWKRGWPSLLAGRAVVHHKHRGTIGKHFSKYYILDVVQRNNTLFFWKNVSDVRYLAAHALFQSTATVRDAARGRVNLRPWRLAFRRINQVRRRIWDERREELWSDSVVQNVANNPRCYRELFALPPAPDPGDRLTIVFVSPYSMFPISHGGAVRMYNVVKRLAERHCVYLLSYIDADDPPDVMAAELGRYGVHVQTVVRQSGGYTYDSLGSLPRGVGEFNTPDFRRELNALLQGDVDVLQIDYTQMAHYVRPSPLYVTALTEHDVAFLSLYRRIGAQVGLRSKVSAWFEWLKMLNYELAHCRKFDLILTVTELEERFLRSYLPETLISSAAPTGIDVQVFQPRSENHVDRDAILFVGYLRHTPNAEAVLYLAEEIFPRVRAIHPGARLTIVGAHPPPAVRALSRVPGITVTGFVDDVRDFYQTHTVLAAPIRSGAGVRVKILEAMASGVPVVTTTLGAEGIRCVSGRDLIIADEPGAFARALVDLLTDPEKSKAVAESARLVIEKHYDWDAIVRKLEELYYERLRAKRAPKLTAVTTYPGTGSSDKAVR